MKEFLKDFSSSENNIICHIHIENMLFSDFDVPENWYDTIGKYCENAIYSIYNKSVDAISLCN